jgi:hypothetical protein
VEQVVPRGISATRVLIVPTTCSSCRRRWQWFWPCARGLCDSCRGGWLGIGGRLEPIDSGCACERVASVSRSTCVGVAVSTGRSCRTVATAGPTRSSSRCGRALQCEHYVRVFAHRGGRRSVWRHFNRPQLRRWFRTGELGVEKDLLVALRDSRTWRIKGRQKAMCMVRATSVDWCNNHYYYEESLALGVLLKCYKAPIIHAFFFGVGQ